MTERIKAARSLASKHYRLEPAITQIHTLTSGSKQESSPAEPIKLLEVNKNTVASGIMPLWFEAAPARGIPFATVIIEVTPEEYGRIRRKELRLPDGWTLGSVIPRPPRRDNSR